MEENKRLRRSVSLALILTIPIDFINAHVPTCAQSEALACFPPRTMPEGCQVMIRSSNKNYSIVQYSSTYLNMVLYLPDIINIPSRDENPKELVVHTEHRDGLLFRIYSDGVENPIPSIL
eukprot:scaffold13371_cov47-Attheya_sp.AAC.3